MNTLYVEPFSGLAGDMLLGALCGLTDGYEDIQSLPGNGLSEDAFHLTFARNFFDDPVRMQHSWPVRNLTALQAIDAVYQGLQES